ncbi:MAG: hypothetical protein HY925_09325, partial [Elusimicrobia bacterium]|nr:hypothetical protein [Elusimicrobiota bacterium]
ASDPRAIVVAFGSPFCLDTFKKYKLGLCTFSPSLASQRAAARALMAMQDAKGKMPVVLKTK